MTWMRRIGSGAALVAGGLLLGPGTAAAQVGAVMPWVGCWVEVGAPADAPMTCFVPENGGAALLTIDRAGVAERRTFRANGVAHPVSDAGCSGVEAVTPSDDGGRLFLRTELQCEGGTERLTHGLFVMIEPDEWIRVRTLEVAGSASAWTQRFRKAPASRVEAAELAGAFEDLALAVESARMAATMPPSVDDVIEATARTHPEAVRTWLAEQGEPLALDRDALVRLADAGVPAEVIDVAIAVSYPDRFALGKQPERVEGYDDRDRYRDPYAYRWGGIGWWPFYYDPWYYSPYSYRRYGGYWGSGWGSWGWSSWGGPGIIVVDPVDDAEFGNGRVIKGRGYTSGRSGTSSGGVRATRRGGGSAIQAGSGVRSKTPSRATRGSSRARTPTRAKPSRGSSSGSSKGKAKPKSGGGGL